MRTTQRLYEAAHPIWEQCHDHPFVRGIGDGSLDLEKFRWFLLQDYLYLFDYAKVFAQGVFAGISNSITAVVVGGLLVLAYTKTIAKKGSLDKE
mgnify:CR=1 FL=1